MFPPVVPSPSRSALASLRPASESRVGSGSHAPRRRGRGYRRLSRGPGPTLSVADSQRIPPATLAHRVPNTSAIAPHPTPGARLRHVGADRRPPDAPRVLRKNHATTPDRTGWVLCCRVARQLQRAPRVARAASWTTIDFIDADRRLGLSRLFVGAWCWTAPRGRQKCNQLGLVLSQAGDQLRRRPQPSIKLLGRRTRDPPYEGVR